MAILSRIKAIVKQAYYQTIFALPIKIAHRLLLVDPDINWSILIYEGNSFLDLQPGSMSKNPVISRHDIGDVLTRFVADPFMVKHQANWLMFFEILNLQNERGEIAYAQSTDGLTWNYQQVVLTEAFHLSYPYVFEFAANWYMIPETCEAGSVRLYKATNFPQGWELVTELLVGERFVDASVVNFDGIWWMFVGVEKDENTTCDQLRLYFADRLDGEWVEHPLSPIVSDNREISRPAGRIIKIDDRLIRFTQDCTQTYGGNVSAIQINLLTKDDYADERVNPDNPYLFKLGTLKCNGLGMHHIDPIQLTENRWIACVDGKG